MNKNENFCTKMKIIMPKGVNFVKIYIKICSKWSYRAYFWFLTFLSQKYSNFSTKMKFLYQKWKFHNLKGINILNWTKILLKIANLGEKVVKNDHFWGDPCSRDIFRDFLTKRKFCVPKWNFGFITYYSILFVLSEPNKSGPGSLGLGKLGLKRPFLGWSLCFWVKD